MRVSSLHRLHWIGIALFLGTALGLVYRAANSQPSGVDMGGYGLLLRDQQKFESALVSSFQDVRLFSDPVVYPYSAAEPGGGKKQYYLVSGRYWDGRQHMKDGKAVAEWVPRCVITQTPYRPTIAVAEPDGTTKAEYPSVLEFLAALNRVHGVTYHYAWWAAYPMLIWVVGSLLVIGGLWPTVVNLLAFGRLTRPPEAPVLSLRSMLSLWNVRSGSKPKPAPIPAPAPAAAGPKAGELDALLEAAMSGTATIDVEPPRPLAKLSSQPLEAVPEGPHESKEYGAEKDDFYPTELHPTGHAAAGTAAGGEGRAGATGRGRRAFSLVELLVVIGIIALLVGLLMPALRMARESGQRTKCAAQLRQLGMAFESYVNANAGWLPAWSGWHTYPPGLPEDMDGPAWTIEMTPYIGDPDSPIYQCPSFPVPTRNYFLSAAWSFANGHDAMKLTDARMSSQYILSGDVTNPGVYPYPYGSADHDTTDADLSDEATQLLCFLGQGGFLMHRNGNNVLFADMHVESFAEFDPAHMSFDPKRPRTWQEVHDGGPDQQ